MPTVVCPSASWPARAATTASSHRATTRGVASTGTSPECERDGGVGVGRRRARPWRPGRVRGAPGYDTQPRLRRANGPGSAARPPVLRRHRRQRTRSSVIEEAVRPAGARQPPCAPAATSPRCSSRTSGRRRRVLDDGRVEELDLGPRPRRRHPGRGRRDHRLRPHRRPLRGRAARRGRGRGRRGAAAAGAAPARSTLTRQRRAPAQRRRDPARATSPRPRKVELLRRADEAARGRRGADHARCAARYGDSRRRILVANSDGLLADDDQVRTLFVVVVRRRPATPACRPAARPSATRSASSCSTATTSRSSPARGRRAGAHQARRPGPAPSGAMPVVIGPGGGGVLFHEACGHGLEADLVGKGASVFTGRVGEQVASPLVTLVDDGTMAERVGQLRHRRRGHARRSATCSSRTACSPTTCGTSCGPARRAAPRSGNGRRQSYQHLPMVRMTNTYLLERHRRPRRHHRRRPTTASTWRTLGGGQVNTATGDFVFGMTEAYLIEDGEITEPIREGNLIGNGPEVLARHRRRRQRLRHGPPGHVRQGRPGRAGRRRRADAAGHRADRRRHRGVSDARREPTCCDIADRVVGHGPATASRSRPSSCRSRDTEVRVYEGEVESLSSAESQGVGVRVVVDGRQGFAYAGTLDDDVAGRDARRGPRQRRVRHARRVPPAWPSPTASAVPTLDLCRAGAGRRSRPTRKVDAGPRARAGRARPPTRASPASSRPSTATRIGRGGRRHHHRHPRRRPRDRLLRSSAYCAGRARATRPRPASASRSAATPDDLDVDGARPRDAAERATRLLGATKPATRPAHRRARPVGHRPVPRHRRRHARRRGGAEGPVAVRRPGRRGGGVAAASPSSTTPPTRGRSAPPPTDGEGLATRRNALIDGGVLAGVPAQRLHGPARRARRPPARRCGRLQVDARRRLPGPGARARATRPPAELLAGVGDGVLVQSVTGLHSGVNPVSAATSRPAPRACASAAARWPSRCASSPIASTLQRMLHDVRRRRRPEWLPMSAAGVTLVVGDVTMSGVVTAAPHRDAGRARPSCSTWPPVAGQARRASRSRSSSALDVDQRAGLRRRGRVVHLGRRPPASACGSCATTGRASPRPGRSTRRSSPRRWPRPATTPRSPSPTSGSAWPSPTAWRRPTSTCGATAWPSMPTERKIELALELERAVRARDPRITGVRIASCGDGSGAARSPRRPASPWPGARPPATCRCWPWPSDGDET